MPEYVQGQGASYILGQFILGLLECAFVSWCQDLPPGRGHTLALKLALATCPVTPQDTSNPLSTLATAFLHGVKESSLPPTEKPWFYHSSLSVTEMQKGSHFKAQKTRIHEQACTPHRMLGCHSLCFSELLCLCTSGTVISQKPHYSSTIPERKKVTEQSDRRAEGDTSSNISKSSPLWRMSDVVSTWLYFRNGIQGPPSLGARLQHVWVGN